jgi:hypothetical protein
VIRIEKPYRRRQTATIEVCCEPDAVFNLMCPVREYEWEPGWTTNLILSQSGLAEEDCVFTTPAGASHGSTPQSADAVWATPVHDREARRLVMIKFTPGECVTRLDISVAPHKVGAQVTTSYAHTALSNAGRKIVDRHSAESFNAMAADWKTAIEKRLNAERPATK